MGATKTVGTLAMITLAFLGLCGCEGDSGNPPIGEATLIGFSSSEDCIRGKGEGYESDDPPKVEILTDGLEVEIIHGNAWFNCCLDTILVDLRQEEKRIILTESEVVTMWCRCNCPFRVTASIEVSLPGDYRIEIYALESLIWTGEVTVTGR